MPFEPLLLLLTKNIFKKNLLIEINIILYYIIALFQLMKIIF